MRWSAASDYPRQVLPRPTGGPDEVRFEEYSWIRYKAYPMNIRPRKERWFRETHFCSWRYIASSMFLSAFFSRPGRGAEESPGICASKIWSGNGLDCAYRCFHIHSRPVFVHFSGKNRQGIPFSRQLSFFSYIAYILEVFLCHCCQS